MSTRLRAGGRMSKDGREPCQTVPNLVAVKSSDTGTVSIVNGSAAPVDMVVDVAGYFTP